ncbi:MAG: hypothetical protein AMXMBFR61_11040 [Fimbriimonadales bacterium]
MMERINRFRRDPRMVAPLSLIAVLVVGYAVQQALAGPSPVRVNVQEVAPRVQTSVTIPTATDSQQAEARNPYFHPALSQPEQPEGTMTDQVPAGGLGGLLPVQPAPSGEPGKAAPAPVTVKAPSGADVGGGQPPPVPEASGSDLVPSLPQYRLVAVVLGSRPAALLLTESGEYLQVMLSDRLPSGERVARVTSTYVALESSGCARILFLSEAGP